MTTPTPLVILARLLSERAGEAPPEFPAAEEARAVRAFLREIIPRLPPRDRSRARAVFEYLDRAARGGRAPGTGAGSLKNLLWLLRDRARELYPGLARALLIRVLEDPDLPLHEGLAGRLLSDPLLGSWACQALEGAPLQELIRLLEWEEIAGWRVAFNFAPANLLSAAARAGADLYAAASSRGAALKAIGRFPAGLLDEIVREAGGEWAAPYPDLRVCRAGAPDPETLRAAVRRVLGGAP